MYSGEYCLSMYEFHDDKHQGMEQQYPETPIMIHDSCQKKKQVWVIYKSTNKIHYVGLWNYAYLHSA